VGLVTYQIVCISRSLGAGGEEIGRRAAEALGFRYADREIIAKAAEEVGVSSQTVAQAESTPGLIGRILEAMGRTAIEPAAWSGAAPVALEQDVSFEPIIKRVIAETAAAGNVVIVAHGASFALAGAPGLLRVLVTAPPERRAARLVEGGMAKGEAVDAVKKSDEQRRLYLKRFYDISEEQTASYDLVVNTDALSPALAAQLVVAAAQAPP
jgi:cytidylate kinase